MVGSSKKGSKFLCLDPDLAKIFGGSGLFRISKAGLTPNKFTKNGEFLSSIIHLLLLIYPIFTCVDPGPDPYFKYGSTKMLNTNPV